LTPGTGRPHERFRTETGPSLHLRAPGLNEEQDGEDASSGADLAAHPRSALLGWVKDDAEYIAHQIDVGG
jgi:hypothetical protein